MIYCNQAHNSITQMTMCKNNNFDTPPLASRYGKRKTWAEILNFEQISHCVMGLQFPMGARGI